MDLFLSTHTSEKPTFLRLLVLFLQETEKNVPTQRPISKARERIYVYLSFRLYILQRRAYLWMAETHELCRLGQIVALMMILHI